MNGEPKPDIQIIETLTIEKAKQLLFKCFYISQGNPYLLRFAMAWVHNNYPQYKISEDQVNDLLKEFSSDAHRYLHPRVGKPAHHVVVSANDEDFTLSQGVTDLTRILNSNSEWTVQKMVDADLLNRGMNEDRRKRTLIENLARTAIARDHHFLITLNGRPTGSDKFFSQICAHALLHRPSGLAETDELFRAVGEYMNIQLQTHTWSRRNFPNLFAMVNKYNQAHPDSQVQLPDSRSNASAQRPPDSMLV